MDASEELQFFGLLVHRGVIPREDADRVMERARTAGIGLGDAAVELGLVDAAKLSLLRKTQGVDVPSIPGFEYVGLAGRGGTAVVLTAKEKKSGRLVAIKMLLPELTELEPARQSFLREAKLLIRLSHPNVVSGEKVGTFHGHLMFLMEHVPGQSLMDLLREGRTFDEDSSLYIVLQVARALTYLSSEGVLHRDIKPDNVLLTSDNTVKLIDLGFAASMGASDEDSETTVGTVAYISPEQARGQGDLDVRSDIYSLGATLYQLAVGELPFSGDSNREILAAQILESLNSQAMHNRRLSPHMRYFIEKMMAKERDIRYQSPQELIEDIEEQIRGKKSLVYNPNASADDELLKKPFDGQAPPAGQTPPEPPKYPTLKRRRRR